MNAAVQVAAAGSAVVAAADIIAPGIMQTRHLLVALAILLGARSIAHARDVMSELPAAQCLAMQLADAKCTRCGVRVGGFFAAKAITIDQSACPEVSTGLLLPLALAMVPYTSSLLPGALPS